MYGVEVEFIFDHATAVFGSPDAFGDGAGSFYISDIAVIDVALTDPLNVPLVAVIVPSCVNEKLSEFTTKRFPVNVITFALALISDINDVLSTFSSNDALIAVKSSPMSNVDGVQFDATSPLNNNMRCI